MKLEFSFSEIADGFVATNLAVRACGLGALVSNLDVRVELCDKPFNKPSDAFAASRHRIALILLRSSLGNDHGSMSTR